MKRLCLTCLLALALVITPIQGLIAATSMDMPGPDGPGAGHVTCESGMHGQDAAEQGKHCTDCCNAGTCSGGACLTSGCVHGHIASCLLPAEPSAPVATGKSRHPASGNTLTGRHVPPLMGPPRA